MSSSTIALQRERRICVVQERARALLVGATVSLACACAIDGRSLENGQLRLPLPDASDAGDAGAAADASGNATPSAAPGSGDVDEPAATEPEETDPPRPVRALGDPLLTGLVGGLTGTDDRARCVEGVLIGFNYAFNDSAHLQFPSRLTFVVPICAVPTVVDGVLEFHELAPLAWSVVGGNDATVQRPVASRTLLCPRSYAVVGLTGSMDEVQADPQLFAVRELEIDCAPLFVQDGRIDISRGQVASVATERFSPAPGAYRVEVACDNATTAATGAVVRWGSWLDAVGLSCSRLAWPFTAGQGCALDEDCQSGVCESFATCAP